MVEEKERDGLDKVLDILQVHLERECREALGDDQPEALAEEIKARVREKVDRELREELTDVLDRMGQEVANEMEAKIRKEEKVRRREEEFLRFGLNFRIQHMLMFTSVIILVITGLPLKFPDLVISEHLISLFGGIQNSTVLHRIGAAGLIYVGIHHFLYTIFSRTGRRDFFLLLPRLQDVKDLITQIKYFLGRSDEHARFGRFSYIEKFDYWAVYWGCVIMIGSGAMLWFQDTALLFLPKYMLDIAKEAHSDEALLATLAIVIWHFYNVHLNPERFPGSLTWWHGRISREEMMTHHPLEYERIMAEREAQEAAEAQKEGSPTAGETEGQDGEVSASDDGSKPGAPQLGQETPRRGED